MTFYPFAAAAAFTSSSSSSAQTTPSSTSSTLTSSNSPSPHNPTMWTSSPLTAPSHLQPTHPSSLGPNPAHPTTTTTTTTTSHHPVQHQHHPQQQQTIYLLTPANLPSGMRSSPPGAPKAKAIPISLDGNYGRAGSRRIGVCKFFNATKGFGFIEDNRPEELPIAPGDPGPDIFVHFSHILASESPFKSLLDGEAVEYSLGRSTKGLAAMDVTAPGGGPVRGNPLARSLSATAAGLTSMVLSPMTLPLPLGNSANPSLTTEPYTVHAPTSWTIPSTAFAAAPSSATTGFPTQMSHPSYQHPRQPYPSFAVTVGTPLYPGGPSAHSHSNSLGSATRSSSSELLASAQSFYPSGHSSSSTSASTSSSSLPNHQPPSSAVFVGGGGNNGTGGGAGGGRLHPSPQYHLPSYLDRQDPYRPAIEKLHKPDPPIQWSPPGGRRASDAESHQPLMAKVLDYGLSSSSSAPKLTEGGKERGGGGIGGGLGFGSSLSLNLSSLGGLSTLSSLSSSLAAIAPAPNTANDVLGKGWTGLDLSSTHLDPFPLGGGKLKLDTTATATAKGMGWLGAQAFKFPEPKSAPAATATYREAEEARKRQDGGKLGVNLDVGVGGGGGGSKSDGGKEVVKVDGQVGEPVECDEEGKDGGELETKSDGLVKTH